MAKTQEIVRLDASARLQAQSGLAAVHPPAVDAPALLAILAATITDIAADAEKRTRDHVRAHLDQNGETWLENGLKYLVGDDCPFCGTTQTGNLLFTAYKGFFSDAYRNHKAEISAVGRRIAESLSEESLSDFQQIIASNATALATWRGFDPTVPELAFNLLTYLADCRQLRQEAMELVRCKDLAPLDSVALGGTWDKAFAAYNQQLQLIATYNRDVASVDAKIVALKSDAAKGSALTARTELQDLQNHMSRHVEDVDRLCGEYTSVYAGIEALKKQKDQAKDALDANGAAAVVEYENTINKHLVNLGVNCTLVQTKQSYSGGKAGVSYKLQLGEAAIDPSASSKVPGNPCFRTALSTGDKRALAFAFFLAMLEKDSKLRNRIIVMDDPMSSFDEHRRTYTADRIADFSTRCAQIVIMTHDAFFAEKLQERLATKAKTLQIERHGDSSHIAGWDIEAHLRSQWYRRYELLEDYASSEGDANQLAVAQSMRPLLEEHLRRKFPRHFAKNTWLGQMIDSIEAADSGDPLAVLKPSLGELRELKNYCKPYHHDSSLSGHASEAVNATELAQFARRAITFVQGN